MSALLSIRVPLWAALLVVALFAGRLAYTEGRLVLANGKINTLQNSVDTLGAALDGKTAELKSLKSQYGRDLRICRDQLNDRDEIQTILKPAPNLTSAGSLRSREAQFDNTIYCNNRQNETVADVAGKPAEVKTDMEIISYEISTGVIDFINARYYGL